METAIKPLRGKLVIKPTKQETTKSGLYIPSQDNESHGMGEIVAVGNMYYENGQPVEMETAVGDKVIYSKYNSTEVKVDGEKYVISTEKDILAIIK